jgi:hypothetical protein
MTDEAKLEEALAPILEVVRTIDPSDPEARQKLEAKLPPGSAALEVLRAVVRAGIQAGALAARENDGIRFGRLRKAASEADLSIDIVHMAKPGPGHTHPNGEIDLCFAVSGAPRFDGNAPGWTVYPPNSWHVPTVEGGVMDILYFLPGGAIRFEPKPT